MTAQEIFEYTMSIIDERLETGLVDVDATLIYKENTPYFLTMLQDELAELSEYTKNQSITVSTEESGYVKLTLPSDYKELSRLIDSNFEPLTDFKRVGTDIYVPYDFSGYLVYKPIMTELSTIDSTLTLDDDICRRIMSYGLASKLLTNENSNLANYFGSIYDDLKLKLKKKEPEAIAKIADVYNSNLTTF